MFRAVAYSARLLINEGAQAKPDNIRRQRSILVITDNKSLSPTITKDELLRRLYANDVTVFACLAPKSLMNSVLGFFRPGEGEGEDVFDLTSATGGLTELFYSPAILKKIFLIVRSQYRLTYVAPKQISGEYHSINVRLAESARQQFKNAKISARAGYFSP